MSKFKVGDKIRLRENLTVKEMLGEPTMIGKMWEIVCDVHLKEMKILVVDKIGKWITVKDNYFQWHEDWFELVKPAVQFKVGDIVMIIDDDIFADKYEIGDVGVITEINKFRLHIINMFKTNETQSTCQPNLCLKKVGVSE